jgi:hypothetical protein
MRAGSDYVWLDDDTQKRDCEDRIKGTRELYCTWMGSNADGTRSTE